MQRRCTASDAPSLPSSPLLLHRAAVRQNRRHAARKTSPTHVPFACAHVPLLVWRRPRACMCAMAYLGAPVRSCPPSPPARSPAPQVRNGNSSRFGKWIEVQFDASGFITASRITSYLLEKSRVVEHGEGERTCSLHILFIETSLYSLAFQFICSQRTHAGSDETRQGRRGSRAWHAPLRRHAQSEQKMAAQILLLKN